MICENKLDPYISEDVAGEDEGVEETDDKNSDTKEGADEKEGGDDMGEEI